MKTKNFFFSLVLFSLLLPLAAAWEHNPLFDINVEIPSSYQSLTTDSDLLVSVKLVNLGSAGRIDVYLDYTIRNEQGKLIMNKLETVAVETQANFIRDFYLPPHLSPGIYTIDVKLIYFDGQEATSRATFKVRENELLTSSVKEKYQSYAIYEAVFYILASLLILDILVILTVKYLWPVYYKKFICLKKGKNPPKSIYISKKSNHKK